MLLAVILALCVVFAAVFPAHGLAILLAVLVLSRAAGILLVIPIGGADMPVVIALLNSYSGIAAAATGFVINNYVLIVSGALVGRVGRHPEPDHVPGDEPLAAPTFSSGRSAERRRRSGGHRAAG